jgi:glycosyltransferase involved in cell wall biosynthesis
VPILYPGLSNRLPFYLMKTSEFPLTAGHHVGWPYEGILNVSSEKSSIVWPKISIVTPSFNQGKYIEETIRSVLLQNYPNLEYIIIDGGSTDETLAIIKKYEPWITYWISEPDRGQSHAINKGLEKCTGEIFNWLNSDDWYMPGSLFEVAKVFMENGNVQFVSGLENHIDPEGKVSLYSGTFTRPFIEETIEFCEVSQPSTFFRLDAIKKVNGVSEDLHYIMDGEMWVQLLLQFGQEHFVKIKTVLVNFRLHANSKTVSNAVVNNFLIERCSIISDLQHFIKVPEKIITYYIEHIYQSPTVYRLNRSWQFNDKVISPRQLRLYFIKKYMLKQFLSGNREEALWCVKQLIRYKSFDPFLLKSMAKLIFKFYP